MAKRSIDIVHPKLDPSSQTPQSAEEIVSDNTTGDSNEVAITDSSTASAPKPPKATPPPSIQPENPTAPPAPRRGSWLAYAAGLLVIGVVVFFGVRAASSLVDVWTDLSPAGVTSRDDGAADETDTQPAAEYSSTTETETETANNATTEETTAAPVTAPAVDKASVKIRILNGSGVSGAAAEAQKVLEAAGFKVESVGNAKQFTYDNSIVYYPAGRSEAAAAVAEALTGSFTATTEENSVADGYDALVVIGKQ